MFGFLLFLLQGGSVEPPSLHDAPSIVGAQHEAERIQLYAALAPSLVQLRLRSEAPDEEAAAGWSAQQLVLSGVVLREVDEGVLVVVPGIWQDQSAQDLAVFNLSGEMYPAQALATAESIGLSLLKVPGLFLEAPQFGQAETLPIGASTFVLGNGFGLYGSFSTGMLSGRGRNLGQWEGLLQITNPVNPGDGGGMLADRQGRLVGIALTSLTDVMRRQQDKGVVAQSLQHPVHSNNVSFALPISRVLATFAHELGLDAEVQRPVLGLQVQEAVLDRRVRRALGLPSRTGLKVVRVVDGFPAQLAGIRNGDVIVALQRMPVQSFACLFGWLDQRPRTGMISIIRGEQQLEIEVKFPSRQKALPTPKPDKD